MTPIRVSFVDGTKQRERGRVVAFVNSIIAIVEVGSKLRVMRIDSLKVLRGPTRRFKRRPL